MSSSTAEFTAEYSPPMPMPATKRSAKKTHMFGEKAARPDAMR